MACGIWYVPYYTYTFRRRVYWNTMWSPDNRNHGGNDKAHAELRSLESSQDFEDRKSCLSTEQVSFESALDSFIIVEKSNTCFEC